MKNSNFLRILISAAFWEEIEKMMFSGTTEVQKGPSIQKKKLYWSGAERGG